MTRTIFRNTFLVGIIILAVCAAVFFGMHYTQTFDETFTALRQDTSYAAAGLRSAGRSYLKELNDVNRITLIDQKGEVLYDNYYSLPLSNQGDCDEVIQAFSTGEGQSTRYSESGGEQALYYASLMEDGTVLRLSRPVSAVRYALISVSPVFWVVGLALILSALLAFRAAKQIVTPVNKIDLDDPSSNPYPELSPLFDRIEEQKQTIKAEISSREKMRREFTANVSHELKTPLTSISGFAELLSCGDVPADKVCEFSTVIYKESQRMITMVDDILKLSRLDEDAAFPEQEEVDLYSIAEKAVESIRPLADRNSIHIELTGVHSCISGAPDLLFDLVYNLVDNAVKYNYPGGSVKVEITLADGRTLLSVSDTGIGIGKEYQEAIFERFYRVDKSHSKEIGGTGLGLSIVKHAAMYHNAEIRIESSEGKGTCICVIF